MANTIKIKNSGTASNTPSAASLQYGELALNYVDGKLYFKNSGTTVNYFTTTNSININDLNDVVITSAASGQFLKYDGTSWVNDAIDLGTDTTGNYVASLVAGTGISLANNTGEGATPTITNTGVTSINTTLTGAVTGIVTTSDTGTVTSAMIADATIVNGDISTTAAIAHSKLANATAGQVLLGTTTTGVITATTLSGDITVTGAGVTAIGSGVVVNADINASAAIALSKLASGTSAQVIVADATGVPTYTTISGDITISNTGVATIAANSVALGTDTTGNYVATLTGTTNQITVTGSGAESAAVTLALPQDIHTSANPTFAGATLDAVQVGITTAGEIDTSTGNLTLDSFGGTVSVDDNLTVSGNATITGNLVVNGTTTTVNSTTITVDDPIITVGGDTAPTADDDKDRGVEFRWHNGTAAKVGFFGYDDSSGKFTFIPDATNTSEVFSGTKGTIDANIDWTDVSNKPDPVVTVTLTGDVTGTASATLTDLASNTVTVSTTIAADSVVLGTDTTGNYMSNVSAGTGISITHTPAEGSTATIAVNTAYEGFAPIGAVMMWSGSSAPTGWAICDGGQLLISSYTALYNIIGTRYGALTNGSGAVGTSHFRLPSFSQKLPKGLISGVPAGSGTPSIANTTIATGVSSAVDVHTHGVNSSLTAGNANCSFTAGNAAAHTHSISGNTTNESTLHVHFWSAAGVTTGTESSGHTHGYFKPNSGTNTNTGGVNANHTHSWTLTNQATGSQLASDGNANAYHVHSLVNTANLTGANAAVGNPNTTIGVNSSFTAGSVNSTLTAGNASTINSSTLSHTHNTDALDIVFIIRIS